MKRAASFSLESVVIAGHKGLAGAEVFFDPREAWGQEPVALFPGRRGFPVRVEINGVVLETAIVGRMRRLFVLLDEPMMRAAGLVPGKTASGVIRPAVPRVGKGSRGAAAPRRGRKKRRKTP